jgi:hypothetical protein
MGRTTVSNDLDTNKTDLTHRVTATAAAYLDGLGCKPIETEVPIRCGWVADLASYWYPTMTEARKLHINRRAREILGITKSTRIPDLIPRAFGHGPFSVLVEVKVRAADFRRDERKWQPGEWPAHICFFAFPTGMLGKDDLPQGWYGLEMSTAGTKLRKVHHSWCSPHPQHTGLTLDFVAAVGIRRDHRTRYTALKAFAKAHRAREREKKARYSAAELLEGLANWVQGQGWRPERSLSDVLPDLGIKKLPQYCRQSVAFFESLRTARGLAVTRSDASEP